jgi:hypothetical protein
MLPDRITGQLREVDIVIEAQASIYPILVGVECVAHARKATVEWVERMWAKHQTLPTNQLVLVSKSGFSHEAHSKARALGIKATDMRSALRMDWESIVRQITEFRYGWVDFHITTCSIIVERDRPGETFSDDQIVYSAQGTPLGSLDQLLDAILEHPDFRKKLGLSKSEKGQNELTHTVTFPKNSYIIDASGRHRNVRRLNFSVRYEWRTSGVQLEHHSFDNIEIAHGIDSNVTGPVHIALTQRRGEPLVMTIGKLNDDGELYEIHLGSDVSSED